MTKFLVNCPQCRRLVDTEIPVPEEQPQAAGILVQVKCKRGHRIEVFFGDLVDPETLNPQE